jgi:hypothetical protein
MPGLPRPVRSAALRDGWSKAAAELREWVSASGQTLALFQAAAERPDGLPHPDVDHISPYFHLGDLSWLVILEASRLQEQGDMEGAWGWYRALYRIKNHVIRRGSMFQRYIVDRNGSPLHGAIAGWAADRRTSAALLRRALDEVSAGEPKPEWDVYSLKVDYLEMTAQLDQPWGWVQQGDDEEQKVQIWGEDVPPNLASNFYAAKRYVSNEPERSRRMLRLAFANWMAHAVEKDPLRKKAAVRARLTYGKRSSSVPFYSVGPEAPEAARKLTPEALAKWLITTRDARLLLGFWPWPGIRLSEQRAHRALVVLLASELFQREKGKRPASEEALVGVYLDHLPGVGSEELDDGRVPVIGDDKPDGPVPPR